jgi:hypothetical protein
MPDPYRGFLLSEVVAGLREGPTDWTEPDDEDKRGLTTSEGRKLFAGLTLAALVQQRFVYADASQRILRAEVCGDYAERLTERAKMAGLGTARGSLEAYRVTAAGRETAALYDAGLWEDAYRACCAIEPGEVYVLESPPDVTARKTREPAGPVVQIGEPPAVEPPEPTSTTATVPKPKPDDFRVYLAHTAGGETQKAIAERMGTRQGQISKMIARVEHWLADGNRLPELPKPKPLHAQPPAVDPAELDLGPRRDRRTPRQRAKLADDLE